MRSRINSVKFHIRSGDYFGTLATVLDLAGQSMETKTKEIKAITDTLNNLKDDLMYLQENYRITRR